MTFVEALFPYHFVSQLTNTVTSMVEFYLRVTKKIAFIDSSKVGCGWKQVCGCYNQTPIVG